MEQAEGELKKGISKHKRRAQEIQKEKRSLRKTNSGKEILYSATPGGEKNRYVNEEFEKSFHKVKSTLPEIFNNNNNNDDTQ